MDLWIARKLKDGSFEAVEQVSLGDFIDLFEEDLSSHGRRLTLRLPGADQEVELLGWIVPTYSKLRRSGRAGPFEARVIQKLTDLKKALSNQKPNLLPLSGEARDAVIALDALVRPRRPYCAIVVS